MIDYEKTKQFWNESAANVTVGGGQEENAGMLSGSNNYVSHFRRIEEEKTFLELLPINKTMNILEVGCGGGRWAFFLADKVNQITGIDFSAEMIRLACSIQKARNINNVTFIASDLLALDTEEKYDVIYFSGVLQYIDDRDIGISLKKAEKMLTPGGVVITRDTVQLNSRVVGDDPTYPVIYRTPAEYDSLFESCRFRLKESKSAHSVHRFNGVCNRLANLKMFSFKTVRSIQIMLAWIDDSLGRPKILMRPAYRKLVAEAGERDHKFAVYFRDEDTSSTQ